jgi:tol-pal system protein YbgF
MLTILLSCVLDRTGQSATDAMRRELVLHDQQLDTLEINSSDVTRRIGQVEEITRSLGQDQLERLETLDAIRQEVAALRGDLEVLSHSSEAHTEASDGFQLDADARLRALETRIQNLERTLGVKPPAATPTPTPSTTTTPGTPTPTPTPAPTPSTPDEVFSLITQNLETGNNAAARNVAQRFLQDNPGHSRAAEAQYRIGESYQNENAFKEAAAAYQTVVDKYKDSSWAPWAMLRQGECFSALGRKDAAELFWNDVIRLYPKSKAAKEAKTYLSQK